MLILSIETSCDDPAPKEVLRFAATAEVRKGTSLVTGQEQQ